VSDPLSDVLSLLQVRSAWCSRLEAKGRWGLSFPAAPLLKFVAVMRGSCWITGASEQPQKLGMGDAFLLINACGYGVSSAPDMALEDGARMFRDAERRIVRLGGAETVLFGGSFIVEGEDVSPLLDVLPSFLVIRADSPAAATLRTTLGMLNAELEAPSIGGALMTKHLADILLLQALRAYAASADADTLSWIGALADKHIGAALTLMHAKPGRRWTVACLRCYICCNGGCSEHAAGCGAKRSPSDAWHRSSDMPRKAHLATPSSASSAAPRSNIGLPGRDETNCGDTPPHSQRPAAVVTFTRRAAASSRSLPKAEILACLT
jgi:hypothetical protein